MILPSWNCRWILISGSTRDGVLQNQEIGQNAQLKGLKKLKSNGRIQTATFLKKNMLHLYASNRREAKKRTKMRKGKYEKLSQKRFPWILVVMAVALIVLLLLLVLKGCGGMQASKQDDTVDNNTTVEKNPDSIAIPGYEMLELKANNKKQSLCMPNPPQNCCYFQIFLYMEDGTLLWKSELIEPGKTSKPIVLSKALEKGMYPNAVLRYSCYRMDENLSPLNGAETKLTLWVK